MTHMEKKSALKVIGLIWIVIECSLVTGNIFGFAPLFCISPRYKSSGLQCEPVESNCTRHVQEYQRGFALAIGFYIVPAVVFGLINDSLGPRCLKIIAVIFHLIGWLSFVFAESGLDWLIRLHQIFISIAGICTLFSSVSISAHFVQHRGLVTSLICGAQLTSSIWYTIFQISIEKYSVSVTILALIWASFSVLMLGSAFLFLDWRFACIPSILKSPSQTNKVNTTASQDSLIQLLKKPLFILVTLFVSCLFLTISFLSVIWHRWLMYSIEENSCLNISPKSLTFWYNMSAAFGILVAPLCGFILDYKFHQDGKRKLLNSSILQTITWICSMVLCLVCMFKTIGAVITALVISNILRLLLVVGSQALIAVIFPSRYIGSLLGIMWTTVCIISLTIYGLDHLAPNPKDRWIPWSVILLLCLLMGGPLAETWKLYFEWGKTKKDHQIPIDEEELNTFDHN